MPLHDQSPQALKDPHDPSLPRDSPNLSYMKNPQVSSLHSVFIVLDQVMSQVEYHCFPRGPFDRIDPLYKELCLIIAEVLLFNHDSFIKINGSFISAHTVQEVYSRINNDHVRLVFDNFCSVSHRIYNKKAYLRTSLYNAVFEIEAHFINVFACN